MNVNVGIHERALWNAEQVRMRLGVRQRGSRRLLHDVAQLACQHELALAAHHAGFDEHDVAADGRVKHPSREANLILPRHVLRMHLGTTDQVRNVLRAHGHMLSGAIGDLARHLASQLADLPLQLTHARFARIAGDHLAERAISQCQLIRKQAVLPQLPRNEIALGDLELFAFRVPREVDRFQSI